MTKDEFDDMFWAVFLLIVVPMVIPFVAGAVTGSAHVKLQAIDRGYMEYCSTGFCWVEDDQ